MHLCSGTDGSERPARLSDHQMRPRAWAWLGALAALAVLSSARSVAAPVELLPATPCVFAGRETTRTVKISGLPAASQSVTASWSLRTEAGHRTLAAADSTAVAVGGSAAVSMTWPVPEVKPGAAVALRVSVCIAGTDLPPQTAEWTVVALPEDAFADWPRPREALRLYDPEGRADVLTGAGGPPLVAIRSLAGLAGQPPAVLLVGPGLDPGRRDLAPQFWELVAAGWTLIVLEPAPGSLPLPGADGPRLGDIRLADARVVAEFDKRLLPLPSPCPTGLALAVHGREPALEAGVAGAPLRWAEFGAADGPGRLWVTTLPMVTSWAESPWGRYLLRAGLAKAMGLERSTGGEP